MRDEPNMHIQSAGHASAEAKGEGKEARNHHERPDPANSVGVDEGRWEGERMIEEFGKESSYDISNMDTEAIVDMLFRLQLEISELRTRVQAQERNANRATYWSIGCVSIVLMMMLLVAVELSTVIWEFM